MERPQPALPCQRDVRSHSQLRIELQLSIEQRCPCGGRSLSETLAKRTWCFELRTAIVWRETLETAGQRGMTMTWFLALSLIFAGLLTPASAAPASSSRGV